MPWVTSFDARLGLNYRLSKDSVITVSVEALQPLQLAAADPGRQPLHLRLPRPDRGRRQGSIPTQFAGVCATTDPTTCAQGNGSLPTSKTKSINVQLIDPGGNPLVVATNPNWGQATAYQAVRQFRFSLRVTF